MTTRTLTFKSTDLGENVNLMLCFAPRPGGNLSAKCYPIAWRVAHLAAKGRSSVTATYANNLAFAKIQVDGSSLVYASNYVPIAPGQQTTLETDSSVNPPTYYFDDPISIGGISVEAKNGTGQSADIALGFIENLGEPNEIMDPAMIYKNVVNGQSITADFVPIVRAYVNMNYSQNQILQPDIQNATPIWEGNLWNMQPFTNLEVYRNERGGVSIRQIEDVNITHRVEFVTTQMDGLNGIDGTNGINRLSIPSVPDVQFGTGNGKKVYTASLAFASTDQVVSGVKALADRLMSNGYYIKFTYKEGSTDAELELALPQNASCDQAEKDMLAAIDAQVKISERVCIRSRGGALMVSAGDNFAYWVDINPASTEWYVSGKNTFLPDMVTGRGRSVQISQNQIGTNGYLSADVGSRATKNRSLSRKGSAVSLRGY
ncbi:hypothetical protein OBBRIDRAFT_832762 [Obba rivulosa]|uniref:Uncharacterized protein n=1 Tax=Obba rivulosa TaxID=1052685 RepID=A0A8E2J4L9_9APHY|nr:hypothetical protein OBBRIDRAFT_832762 [Obba rivulosa]